MSLQSPLHTNPCVAAHRQDYNSVIQLHTVTHTLYGGVLDGRVLYVALFNVEPGNGGATHKPHKLHQVAIEHTHRHQRWPPS